MSRPVWPDEPLAVSADADCGKVVSTETRGKPKLRITDYPYPAKRSIPTPRAAL